MSDFSVVRVPTLRQELGLDPMPQELLERNAAAMARLEELGRQMAERREQAIFDAVFGPSQDERKGDKPR